LYIIIYILYIKNILLGMNNLHKDLRIQFLNLYSYNTYKHIFVYMYDIYALMHFRKQKYNK